MVSKNIQTIIPKLQEELTKQPVQKAWLFGSCSRGEEKNDSDIDLLVQYDDKVVISLFTIARIMCELQKAVGRPVDLIEDGQLLPFAIESVNRDKILIYERPN
ncbi:MAG: nucleotidyltransferase domain-containing protein [Bacteroidales bacterium]|jgi:hypothetical protein|nr:nucleotidyltransferase domain-containing protein [Bacteroidales bacterium]